MTLLTKHGGDMLEKRTAIFSPCERYRYLLRIVWDPSKTLAQCIGLNPSRATEMIDDNTVRRVKSFARSWGHGGLLMTNIFAYRATLPQDMKAQAEPIGEGDCNDEAILDAAAEAAVILCAWGKDGEFLRRGPKVKEMLSRLGHPLHCFKLCQNGEPYHPLYMAAKTPLMEFK